MSAYKVILFDLDGTISNPKVGIVKSVQYALQKMDIIENDLNKLDCFIGPPLHVSFADYYDFNEEKAKLAVEYYRERFKEKGIYENDVYPEIPALLKSLREQGYILVIATSKPTVFAEEIITYFNLQHYFHSVIGSYLDGSRSDKTEIIQYILNLFVDYKKDEFVMIGDRKHDIIGANNVSIDSIGVLYGYGSTDEIRNAKCTYIAKTTDDIKELLLGNRVK